MNVDKAIISAILANNFDDLGNEVGSVITALNRPVGRLKMTEEQQGKYIDAVKLAISRLSEQNKCNFIERHTDRTWAIGL